jgi:hypothetical protein
VHSVAATRCILVGSKYSVFVGKTRIFCSIAVSQSILLKPDFH